MSRVLVTGGGGFVGSHLVERLRAAGEDPFVARRADYDLTRWDDAERLFRDARPELVYHLAAEVGGIGANRANPGRYWYANLMMGAHMLELARQNGTGKVVVAGTVCAYPKHTPVPFSEDDLWNGFPEETNAHVIPDLIRKMVDADGEIVRWGDGSPPREVLYVDDLVEGLLLAAERYDGPEPVNLGSGAEISIRELAELVADVTGFAGEIAWDTSMPNGQPRRGLDATRARELFGFEARTPLREGLERTVAWYRESRYAGVER
jgi:GDP-L-fucose synthase